MIILQRFPAFLKMHKPSADLSTNQSSPYKFFTSWYTSAAVFQFKVKFNHSMWLHVIQSSWQNHVLFLLICVQGNHEKEVSLCNRYTVYIYIYIYVVPLETLWHRGPHGSGSPQKLQNIDNCLAFFWTGFHYSDSRQYFGDPCCEIHKSFH